MRSQYVHQNEEGLVIADLDCAVADPCLVDEEVVRRSSGNTGEELPRRNRSSVDPHSGKQDTSDRPGPKLAVWAQMTGSWTVDGSSTGNAVLPMRAQTALIRHEGLDSTGLGYKAVG